VRWRLPRSFTATVATILAAACTGSGPVARVSGSPVAGRPLVYVAVGASETAGVGTDDPIEDAWPRVLWHTLPPGSALYDFGVGGSTADQALQEQVGAAARLDADLATVWLNVNDLLHGVPAKRYGVALRQIVHDLRGGGNTTVLVANTPRLDMLPAYLACRTRNGLYVAPLGDVVQCPQDLLHAVPSPVSVRAAVDAYNRQIARVVRDEGAVLVDLHALGDIPIEHPDWVSDDGFHPSTVGAVNVAAAFEQALGPTGP
jgi:acyl-CoA thioesterase I